MTASKNGMGGDIEFDPKLPGALDLGEPVTTAIRIPPLGAWISCRNEGEGRIFPQAGNCSVFERLQGADYWPQPTLIGPKIRSFRLRHGAVYCVVNDDDSHDAIVKVEGSGSLFIEYDLHGASRRFSADQLPGKVRERITGGLIDA